MEYKTFLRHAEKVTKTPKAEDRPYLAGVYHHPDGSVIATDGFRLYKVLGTHHNKELGSIWTPKGKQLDLNYPGVDRLFPRQNPRQVLELPVQELFKVADLFYSVGKLVTDQVVIEFLDGKATFSSPEISGSYDLSTPFEEPIALNALFLLDAMRLFKADKEDSVIVNFYGTLRPLVVESASRCIQVIILPIRMTNRKKGSR